MHGSDDVRDTISSFDEDETKTVIEKGADENEDDDGLKAQEDVDKQRMEKVYRKQEEEWLSKREKVRELIYNKIRLCASPL